MDSKNILENVYQNVNKLYLSVPPLPFHGFHHIVFVYHYARDFSLDLGCDPDLVQIAALVHDLNYLVQRGILTSTELGADLREQVLRQSGCKPDLIGIIENIIQSASTSCRDENISIEAQALSDADTLFKSLPITPILFASRFIEENNYSLEKLSAKIVADQTPLMNQGIYFYSPLAKAKYMKWAETNLALWQNVQESLQDKAVRDLLTAIGAETA